MSKKRILNKHHIIYPSEKHPEQEWIEVVYKGEHKCISNLAWYTRKTISKGLIRALKFFILQNEERAIELDEPIIKLDSKTGKFIEIK